LTYCTTFGRTHRFWCLFAWPFTFGMRSVGGFRCFNVGQLKRPPHLRCRSDPSRKKLESALAHSASDKNEIHQEHNREQVSEPANLASVTTECFHHCVADKSKRQTIGN